MYYDYLYICELNSNLVIAHYNGNQKKKSDKKLAVPYYTTTFLDSITKNKQNYITIQIKLNKESFELIDANETRMCVV